MIWQVLRPSSLMAILAIIGLIAALQGRRRLGLFLFAVVTVTLAVAATLPIGELAMGTLERYYPPAVEPSKIDGIIVLAGAVRPSLTEQWHQPSLTDGAERMTGFVALARRHPEARLVFSGGVGKGKLLEADVAKSFFEEMGLDTDRIVFERASQNTWQNATLSKALVAPRPGETWLLVTSAFHMRRALGCFHKIGWSVQPWPVGFKSGRLMGESALGNAPQQLMFLDYAAHEWIGLAAYSLLGRIDLTSLPPVTAGAAS